jgi:hypothetical protein
MSSDKVLPKTPSRWDALGDSSAPDSWSRNHNRGGYRQQRPNIGTLLQREEKWVNDKPGKQYTRLPNGNSMSHFPVLDTSAADTSAADTSAADTSAADTSANYAALDFTDEPVAPPVSEQQSGMISLRSYKKREPKEETDPYLSCKMYWAIEEMKARWYRYNEQQGVFVDYDHILDEHGIDSWDTGSDSEGSEEEEEFDIY